MATNSKIEWRVLENYPLYRVSNTGRVQSKAKKVTDVKQPTEWREKKIWYDKGGYGHVTLGRGVKKRVHLLVIRAFIGEKPNIEDNLECRHMDGNPANNHISNLSWGTPKENQSDQYAHGTRVMGNSHPMSKITVNQRLEIIGRYQNGELQRELANEFGITQSTVSYLVNNKLYIDG